MKTFTAVVLLLAFTCSAHAHPYAIYECGKDTEVVVTGARIVITVDGAAVKNTYRLKWSPDKKEGTSLRFNGRRCERNT
jgi:hypothetical protein